jgi:glycerate-2-kinase
MANNRYVLTEKQASAMSFIKNRKQLLSHGNTHLRKIALDIIEYALTKADPYRATRDLVKLDKNSLLVGDLKFDLAKNPRIFLIGAGKATFPIAKALEDLLDNRIADGVIICKYGQGGNLVHCRLHLANHPIPDESGLAAAKEALALAQQTLPGDIVFGCITGGSSALLPYPAQGITLDEKKRVNQLLLTCGANIIEINAVRKHLSRVKGGRLAQAIHPQTHLINLTVSDVIGDPLDYITDPTVPDTSTLNDARNTLSKYKLWDRLPLPVAGFLKSAGPEYETPKASDLSGHQRHDFIIVSGDAACIAAHDKARDLGFDAMILSTMFEGESRELGRTFAAIAREIILNQRPLDLPAALIGGGETTVKIDHAEAGKGGPNQEFAVAAALEIAAVGNVVVAGFDSDGTDGPTEVAGGIVDEKTLKKACEQGIDMYAALQKHDVTPVLQRLGNAIHTGATGTNVNDLKFLLIS